MPVFSWFEEEFGEAPNCLSNLPEVRDKLPEMLIKIFSSCSGCLYFVVCLNNITNYIS